MNKIILLLVFGLCTAQITAQTITLEQAMAHPDWLGRQPQQPYWSDDSESVYYRRKRINVEQTDLFRVSINGQTIEQIYPEDFLRLVLHFFRNIPFSSENQSPKVENFHF